MGKHKFLTKEGGFKQRNSTNTSNKNGGSKGDQRRNKFRKANPLDRKVKPEEATPWIKLKEAFLQQEMEINKQKKLNSKKGDVALQSGKQNYKKSLIKEKQKEETVWEELSPENDESRLSHKHNPFRATSSSRYIKQDLNNEGMSSEGKKFLKTLITSSTKRARGVTFFGALKELKLTGVKRMK